MNALITKEAELVECTRGRVHDDVCFDEFGCTLADFVQNGGIRVKLYHDEMAVETYGEINNGQRKVINRMLRDNTIYVIVYQINRRWNKKSALRPIKSFRG